MLKRLLWFMFFRPSGLFTYIRRYDLFSLAFGLQFFRWQSTALTTVVSLYQTNAPMLLPVPFGYDPQAYRFFEIFAYGPYGMVMITLIALFVWYQGRSYARLADMTFRQTWTLIGFSFFGPWLPCLLIDNVLVLLGWGGPGVIVPWHVAIVLMESILTMIGLNAVFGIPMRYAIRLGTSTGLLFLMLAGAVIR